MDYTIHPIPISFRKKVIDLYKEHMLVAATSPGILGWRINRQFSVYWDNGGGILGCLDTNNELVGFVAWKIERTLDPYRGLVVEFDDKKKRHVMVEPICWHEQLLVVPTHRGKGLGTRMMREMFSVVNSNKICNICHEERLVKYYGTMGFVNVYNGIVPQNPDQVYWINERGANGSE